MRTKAIYALILLSILFNSDSRPVSAAAGEQKRIRFQVTTISDNGTEHKILAQTTIEGLPGTDFKINLQTENFKMQTRFLSDLIAPEKLKMRANLDTRRFYGYSNANLPLYEEDSQKQDFEIGFDEKIVLLPFGRNGGDETLKIEITPSLLTVSKEEAKAPIKINFNKQIQSGEISIEASKIPHRFVIEASLLANGQEAASGSVECLLEEEKEIVLQAKPGAGSELINRPFAAKVKIDQFNRSRPKDLAGMIFDVYRRKSLAGGDTLPIIKEGAGMGVLGEDLKYVLENGGSGENKNYEMKFNIRLASGEEEQQQ